MTNARGSGPAGSGGARRRPMLWIVVGAALVVIAVVIAIVFGLISVGAPASTGASDVGGTPALAVIGVALTVGSGAVLLAWGIIATLQSRRTRR